MGNNEIEEVYQDNKPLTKKQLDLMFADIDKAAEKKEAQDEEA